MLRMEWEFVGETGNGTVGETEDESLLETGELIEQMDGKVAVVAAGE